MNLTRDRVHSLGWAFVITVCIALVAVLTLRVNATRSEVHDAEKRIVSLKREILFLETEYHTRSNQHQLGVLNQVEFGYEAPRAEQYVEGERQLAALGKPKGPGAPKPIRVANAAVEPKSNSFLAFVSPVTGTPATAPRTPAADATAARKTLPAKPSAGEDVIGSAIEANDLERRLGRIELPATEKSP